MDAYVTDAAPTVPPAREPAENDWVRLIPVCAREDASALFHASHGTAEKRAIWDYQATGPYPDIAAMRTWLEEIESSNDPLFFTVADRLSGRKVGMVSFLNITPAMRRVEIGHIWYAPEAQRTKVNSAAVLLMLSMTLGALRYRRVEWKCDALNARSRAAALRLGFRFEGVFRQHMIVKGRNRDTAWYSMLDSEWPRVHHNLLYWLTAAPGTVSLTALSDEGRGET